MFIELLSSEERGKLFDSISAILECKNKYFGYEAKWGYDDEKGQCVIFLDVCEHKRRFLFKINDFEFLSDGMFKNTHELKKARKCYFSYMSKRFLAYNRYLAAYKKSAKMSYNQSMSL